jgi:hypothetical protein
MNRPGRTVSGWWDRHNNAVYLETLVRGRRSDEKGKPAPKPPEDAPLGLLWRPITFRKSASSKGRETRAETIPQPRESAPSGRRSRIAGTIRSARDVE